MADLLYLFFNCPINLRNPMTVNRNPERRYTVYISSPFCINKVNAVAFLNNNRLLILVLFHLRERVPDKIVVKFCKLLCSVGHFILEVTKKKILFSHEFTRMK